jgi:hypothetical protein
MSDHPRTATKFVVRVLHSVFGGLLMFVSGYGILHRILWVPQFNYRYGEQGIASLRPSPLLSFVTQHRRVRPGQR